MRAELLSVGTELLLGEIVNTNAQFLSEHLAQLGIDIYYQTVVGDNPRRLKGVMGDAFSRSDLVITTGGLGPTEDDLTKEIGAEYFERSLDIDEKALSSIESFFNKIDRKMEQNNVKQAMVPKGAIILYNEMGTAPGIIIENENKILVMLPGPPREMQTMFLKQVKPYLEEKQDSTFVSRVLRVAGVGESSMEMMVRDLIDCQTNPTIAPYAKGAEALLRITAKAATKEEGYEMIKPVAEEIYKRFGDSIYAEGETSIQETVAKLLKNKGNTIAVAESLTGGLISSQLVEIPGISNILLEGIVAYSNEAKISRLGVKKETLEKYGAVSAETAVEMAKGVAEVLGADIGLATTGAAGPDSSEGKPVGLVFIGLFINGKTLVKEMSFSGKRNVIRERGAFYALDYLRKNM